METASLTLFGTTQRVYRGFSWWVTAQLLQILGFFLQSLGPRWPLVSPLAHALEIHWPVVVLSGLRGFFARREWRVPVVLDACSFSACFGAWSFGAWWPVLNAAGRPDAEILAFHAASGVLQEHAAVSALMLPDMRRSWTLKVCFSWRQRPPRGPYPALRLAVGPASRARPCCVGFWLAHQLQRGDAGLHGLASDL